jgi:hypothetical protein
VLRVELGNDNLVAMLCTSRAYASQPCWLALAHVRVGPVPVLEARSSPPYTFRVPHPAPHRTASSRHYAEYAPRPGLADGDIDKAGP